MQARLNAPQPVLKFARVSVSQDMKLRKARVDTRRRAHALSDVSSPNSSKAGFTRTFFQPQVAHLQLQVELGEWLHRFPRLKYKHGRVISNLPAQPLYDLRRSFHASNATLDRGTRDTPMVPPKPRRPTRDEVTSGGASLLPTNTPVPISSSEWGLRRPSMREPTFWRPKPAFIERPPRVGGSTGLVPPVRGTAAGVTYKKLHNSTTTEGRPEVSLISSRLQAVCAVEKAIQKTFGNDYTVEMFGSTRYGVSTASSDLDLVIIDHKRKHGFVDKPSGLPPIYKIRKVSSCLKRAGFKVIETVSGATVPIVKFRDQETGLMCDINVNDRLGCINSDLIRRYCQLNPVLAGMIMYIKHWAKPLGLNSSNPKRAQSPTFSSYALAVMTIGFLQHRELLPNLQDGLPPLKDGELQGTFWLRYPPNVVCDVRYRLASGWKPPQEVPMPQLMHDWFKFWASESVYDNETMIDIRQGGLVPRSSLSQADFRGTLWVIDPFIRIKNIAQNVGRKSISRFQEECLRHSMMPEFEKGALPVLPPLPTPTVPPRTEKKRGTKRSRGRGR